MKTKVAAATLVRAGVAKAEITGDMPATDPLYVKALVLQGDSQAFVIVTVDAVAIAEIGTIRNDYLSVVRTRLKDSLGILPIQLMINASHCHGVVCDDIEDRTVGVVEDAWRRMVPVRVGAGTGFEDRIMENRRLRLVGGREADVRRAYALPPDAKVESVGPVDPEIGILKLEQQDGQILAVVFNFACHPIQGVPGGDNTADLTGFACKVVEEHAGGGAIALFLQGCAGDVNPIFYRDFERPPDAEPLGNRLGLSTVWALQCIRCQETAQFEALYETLQLPRADLSAPIQALQAKQQHLLKSLEGTSLNLKSFMALAVKYGLGADYPSYDAHRYLHDAQAGRNHLRHLDAENRRQLQRYRKNAEVMEELTRVQTNLALLEKHQCRNNQAPTPMIDVEMLGLRIGQFVLLTFPGELSVEIGLALKQKSPHPLTFIAGVTNGYIYYAPTANQLKNRGGAQEDSDCLLAPEWQELFETEAVSFLERL